MELRSPDGSPYGRSMALYCYEELSGPDKIRTIRLHATKSRIECSFDEISVSEGGFQALSYVWGVPEKPCKIVVLNSQEEEIGYIPLTASLQQALQDLRDADEIEEKVFWIDQVCIHQEGREKSGQVAMMGQIYRDASRVVTYIGSTSDDEEEERRGMALLQRLDKHFEESYEMMFEAGSLFKCWNMTTKFPVAQLPQDLRLRITRFEDDEMKYIDQGWRWLVGVAFHPWTQRQWIVQEQTLNKDTVVLYATYLLSWDALAAVPMMFGMELLPNCYVRRFWKEATPPMGAIPSNISASVYSLWHKRKAQQRDEKEVVQTLLVNMSLCEDLKCWDPRDRIFALLAISSDAERLNIKADYSDAATASRVFLDVSIRILQCATDLQLLRLVCRWGIAKPSDESPMLGPQQTPSENLSWALSPLHSRQPPSGLTRECGAHPWKKLSSQPRSIADDQVLLLKGRLVDQITISTTLNFTCDSIHMGFIDESWVQSMSQFLRCFAEVLVYLGPTVANTACLCRATITSPTWILSLKKCYSVPQSIAYSFWCYLRGMVNKVRKYAVDLSVDVGSLLRQCDPIIFGLASQLGSMIDLKTFQIEADETPDERAIFTEVFKQLKVHGRSFCITKDGRVCNAMNQAKPGDVVTALQGSDKLWILRPVGKRYRLIGDAYVDGLMNGEAYDGVDPHEMDYDIELI